MFQGGGCDFVLCAKLTLGPYVSMVLVDVGTHYSLLITLKWGGLQPNLYSWSFVVGMTEW